VRNECDIDALVRSYQVWKKHNPAYAAESLDSFFNDDLAHRVLPFAYFRSHLRALFVRAAAHPDITAWVAANDTVAVEAMKYCVHNAISVPQHISLIGFDDSAAALQAGLSSYNFDIPSLSHLILEWILLNRSAPASRPDTRESVSGTVVQRHSTGRV
jgi:DNA-binding LacI/PurR family transcriptional regulator